MDSQPFALEWICIGDSNDRDVWLDQRKTGVSASEIASIMDLSPWVPMIAVWAGKECGPNARTVNSQSKFEQNERMFWGLTLEPGIISGFGARTGRHVVPWGLLLRRAASPVLLATPDALTTDDPSADPERMGELFRWALVNMGQPPPDTFADEARKWWPLQVKNSDSTQMVEWEHGPPIYYQVQAKQEAIVFGATRATVAGLFGGSTLMWADIDVDPKDPELFARTAADFWLRHVMVDCQPSPDGTAACGRILATLYRNYEVNTFREIASPLQVDGEWIEPDDFDSRYMQARERKRQASHELDLLENIMRDAIRDVEGAIMPNGARYNLRVRSYPEFVMPARQSRVLTRRQPPKPRKTKRS